MEGTFNSRVNPEDYKLIKMEAIKLGKKVKEYISEIITEKALELKKEAENSAKVIKKGKA